MRKRFGSESENSITQVVVEEEHLYKDKALPEQSITSKFFNKLSEISQSKLPLTQSNYNNSNTVNSVGSDDLYSSIAPEPEEIFVMTARDRTGEFANLIRSAQGRNINRVVNLKDPKKVKQMQSYSEFMTTAKSIGRNIASTYTKLEKLTLCK
jgi:hypothetical protein